MRYQFGSIDYFDQTSKVISFASLREFCYTSFKKSTHSLNHRTQDNATKYEKCHPWQESWWPCARLLDYCGPCCCNWFAHSI